MRRAADKGTATTTRTDKAPVSAAGFGSHSGQWHYPPGWSYWTGRGGPWQPSQRRLPGRPRLPGIRRRAGLQLAHKHSRALAVLAKGAGGLHQGRAASQQLDGMRSHGHLCLRRWARSGQPGAARPGGNAAGAGARLWARALEGHPDAPHLHERQAVLCQNPELRHGSGDHDVKALHGRDPDRLAGGQPSSRASRTHASR